VGGRTVRAVEAAYVQRVAQERLLRELGKAEQLRNPPVPVWAWLLLDGAELAGDLLGWAENPNGAGDGLRGLVLAVREYAPGHHAEFLGWVPAERIRQR
jgi:hypothetical protein